MTVNLKVSRLTESRGGAVDYHIYTPFLLKINTNIFFVSGHIAVNQFALC